jgi:hypothetical protein
MFAGFHAEFDTGAALSVSDHDPDEEIGASDAAPY